MSNLPGSDNATDPVSMVCNLSSLMTVCALALDSVDDWNDSVRQTVTQDIKHILEFGAVLAQETAIKTEHAIAGGSK